jgi:hypothetical protein
MALADYQYTLLDFENIKHENTIKELDVSVINIINEIAKRVGAPNYQKTPVFKKKDKRYFNKKGDTFKASRDNDVEFKKTELKKNEFGIDVELDKLRSLLNKLTKKNYDDISSKIINSIQFIVKFESKDIQQTLGTIGNFIFEIGSSNKFLSQIYAKLYCELMKNFPFMKEMCIKNYSDYENIFHNIEMVEDAEDYEKFCLCNKNVEKRRSLCSFLVHLINYNVLEIRKLIELIDYLILDIKSKINNVENKRTIEELIEIISILVINGCDTLQKQNSSYKKIYNFIQELSEANNKDYPALSNKIIFKCIDIIEEIED